MYLEIAKITTFLPRFQSLGMSFFKTMQNDLFDDGIDYLFPKRQGNPRSAFR